jgi:hypothetical protein
MEESKFSTEADAGICMFCRLRAFFVSGEWWCQNQHYDGAKTDNKTVPNHTIGAD